jgi:hypothetical protein
VLPDAAAALAAAKKSGVPVEVASLRSESSQVMANPSGSLTRREFLRPRWARAGDGSWVDADATLGVNDDGSVSPVAATLPMVFSGGGGGPLARIGSGDQQLSVSWPDPLPAPVVAGATVTYPEVLAGVDLRVQADVDRFSTPVVVKTRQAAANPALRTVRFLTSGVGVHVQADPATGALAAVDRSGAVVFDGGAPMMWDSSDVAAAAAARRLRATTGEPDSDGDTEEPQPRIAAMGVAVTGSEVDLTPDAGMMADAATRFPVVLDPTWGRGRSHWSLLRRSHPSTPFWDVTSTASDDGTRGAVKTGYSTDSQGVYSDRSVFEFDISGVRGAAIRSAQFSLVQMWSWKACGGSAPPVRLYETPGINGSTTWNIGWNTSGSGWGTELGNADVRRYNGTGNCASSRILFNVQGKIQSLANAGADTVTLGLKGDGDLSADLTGHRRYDLATVYLSIDYNLPPDRPDGLLINGKPCTQGPGPVGGQPGCTHRPAVRSRQRQPQRPVRTAAARYQRFVGRVFDGGRRVGGVRADRAGHRHRLVRGGVPVAGAGH